MKKKMITMRMRILILLMMMMMNLKSIVHSIPEANHYNDDENNDNRSHQIVLNCAKLEHKLLAGEVLHPGPGSILK